MHSAKYHYLNLENQKLRHSKGKLHIQGRDRNISLISQAPHFCALLCPTMMPSWDTWSNSDDNEHTDISFERSHHVSACMQLNLYTLEG